MPGGLRTINTRLEETRESLRRTREETEKTTTTVAQYLHFVLSANKEAEDATAQTIAQLSVAYGEAQRIASEVEAEFQQTILRLSDLKGDLFDFGGRSLEEFVSGQRELIEQIEATGFGAHLEIFAKSYIGIQAGRDTDGRLFKQLEQSEKLIRMLTGSAGQAFDFYQFKADIDAALKGLKEEISGGGGTGGYGYTSGSLGSNSKPGCGAQMPSLSILAHAGALRWR